MEGAGQDEAAEGTGMGQRTSVGGQWGEGWRLPYQGSSGHQSEGTRVECLDEEGRQGLSPTLALCFSSLVSSLSFLRHQGKLYPLGE